MDLYVCGAYGQGGLDRPASIPPFLGAREGRFPSFFFLVIRHGRNVIFPPRK